MSYANTLYYQYVVRVRTRKDTQIGYACKDGFSSEYVVKMIRRILDGYLKKRFIVDRVKNNRFFSR
jgi:hypothetical protein